MSNELEDIILTIDTREQNQRRIKAVEDWALSHGAIVEHSALKLCDYRILGEFRGQSINLGIEAKSLPDFASSYSELPDKLARAFQLYDDVALFVEAGNYTFTPDIDNFHATIDNPAVRNGNADVLPLAAYENMLASFQREGVHVRQLRSEAHFPYAIAGLLINIIKPIHTGLHIKAKDYTSQYLNVLTKVPHIGITKAIKLIENYPNLNWLCGVSEDSYRTILGEKTGSQLYAFIRCHELETDEWRNGYHRDGTEKDELDQVQKYGDGAQTLVKSCAFATPDPKNRTECKTPNHFKDTPKEFIVGFLTQNPAGIKYPDLVKVIKQKYPDMELVNELIESLMQEGICYEPRIGLIAINSSHAEGTILSNHNHPLPSADTISSHPSACGNIPVHKDAHVVEGDTFSHSDRTQSPQIDSTPQQRSGDIPQPPITKTETTAVKQEGLSVSFFPPAEINIGLNDKPLDCVVKCRVCHQVIIPEQDDESGFCHDPDCIKIRGEPLLENKLRIYLREPHTVQEIVEKYGCSPGYTYQVCMANVNSGNIKKMTEQNGRVTFQRIIC